jgi:hypothetical protein
MTAPRQFVEQHHPTNRSQSNDFNGHAKLKPAQKSIEFDLADAECLQRFLKIKVGDLNVVTCIERFPTGVVARQEKV